MEGRDSEAKKLRSGKSGLLQVLQLQTMFGALSRLSKHRRLVIPKTPAAPTAGFFLLSPRVFYIKPHGFDDQRGTRCIASLFLDSVHLGDKIRRHDRLNIHQASGGLARTGCCNSVAAGSGISAHRFM